MIFRTNQHSLEYQYENNRVYDSNIEIIKYIYDYQHISGNKEIYKADIINKSLRHG